MKTLSINPFNLKQVKCALRKQKHVEIPTTLPPELYDKLKGVQGSLDYMATNLGMDINIRSFSDFPFNKLCMFECDRGKKWYYTRIYANNDELEITKLIYKAASYTYPQKPDPYESAKKHFNINR